MLKIFSRNLVLLCSLCVLGCTKVGIHARPYTDTTDETPVGKLDFGWRLSGDRSVAPLQIFSDATRIWLQWGSQQTLPALIGLDEHGERVLPYRLQGPYAVIDGRWTQLQFRAGSLLARARRVAEPRAGGAVTTPPPQPSERTPVSLSVVYAVTPKDLHLRQALGRWASIADWRFQPDHRVQSLRIILLIPYAHSSGQPSYQIVPCSHVSIQIACCESYRYLNIAIAPLSKVRLYEDRSPSAGRNGASRLALWLCIAQALA